MQRRRPRELVPRVERGAVFADMGVDVGTEEIEAVTVIDVLRRAGAEVVVSNSLRVSGSIASLIAMPLSVA